MNLDDISIFDQVLTLGSPEMISFRVNPGLGAGKFAQIIVGGEGTKFGMSEEKALEAYKVAKAAGIKKFGMHMMTGSCILDADYFLKITGKILEIASHISKTLDIDFEFIDIGGGFGIPYEPGEKELDVDSLAEKLCTFFVSECKKLGLKQPKMYMEPGRFLVGESGLVLTKVNQVKVEPKHTFAGLDAGMTTLLRPALYGAYHHFHVLGGKGDKKKYHLVGPICESTDCFAEDRELPELARGDLLAIYDAGAYGYAMSSNFNGRLRPKEILILEGKDYLVRDEDTAESELAKQKLP